MFLKIKAGEKKMSENTIENVGKKPCISEVEMTELVLPNDANILGNLLGGRLMHWIDIAAAIAASRHCNKAVVTRAMESLDFKKPVHIGEIVILKAKLIWTGTTSMKIMVKVFKENLKTGQILQTNEAFLTFVAVDENAKPVSVPALLPESAEEILMFQKEEDNRKNRIK
jgi:acyl-CoA hydrolase